MAISEEARHKLYSRLEEVLGRSEATVLMEHLPPVGWADVATRRDVDALEERVELRLDARFTQMTATLEREMRLLTWRFIVALLTALSIGLAVARL